MHLTNQLICYFIVLIRIYIAHNRIHIIFPLNIITAFVFSSYLYLIFYRYIIQALTDCSVYIHVYSFHIMLSYIEYRTPTRDSKLSLLESTAISFSRNTASENIIFIGNSLFIANFRAMDVPVMTG